MRWPTPAPGTGVVRASAGEALLDGRLGRQVTPEASATIDRLAGRQVAPTANPIVDRLAGRTATPVADPALDRLVGRQVTPPEDPEVSKRTRRLVTPLPPAGVSRIIDAARGDHGDRKPLPLPQDPIWTPNRIRHVLDGDENGGWHHRPNGVDPPGRTLVVVTRRVTRGRLNGVYRGIVEVYETDRKRVKQSTFFPDHWSRSRIIDTINEACREALARDPGHFVPGIRLVGRSGTGFPVRFVVEQTGAIVTAVPHLRDHP